MGVFAFTGGVVDKAETTVLAICVKADAIVSTLSVSFLLFVGFCAHPRMDHEGDLPYFGVYQRLMPLPTVCIVFW